MTPTNISKTANTRSTGRAARAAKVFENAQKRRMDILGRHIIRIGEVLTLVVVLLAGKALQDDQRTNSLVYVKNDWGSKDQVRSTSQRVLQSPDPDPGSNSTNPGQEGQEEIAIYPFEIAFDLKLLRGLLRDLNIKNGKCAK